MQLHQDVICRGDGKIFIRYSVASEFANSNIIMVDTDKDGNPLPSKIYEQKGASTEDARSIVAVIPNIPITQFLKFEERDGGGSVLGEPVTKKISFEQAKWQSRLNYRLQKKATQEIRNFDESESDKQIIVHFLEVIPFEEFYNVRVLLEVPQDGIRDLRVRCTVPGSTWEEDHVIWLGEQDLYPSTKHSPEIKEIRFAMRVPKKPQYYLFDIQNVAHPQYSNFGVLEAKEVKRLEGDWHYGHMSAMGDPSYTEWFEETRAKGPTLSRQSGTELGEEPVFSIIVPLFNTPIAFLRDMIGSVLAQSYESWELILVNASPDNAELAEEVAAYLARDQRIKEFKLEDNLGISKNTQAGISHATGDFICFFDHDDTLEPDILFEYAKAISLDPNIDLLYCDEDKIMPDGKYGMPYFKPDFSIDLLRSNNYICHLLCIRKSLLDQLEPSPSDVDGAQDHDLTLKAVEKTKGVHHVPKVLYHWRIHRGSTAANAESKSYAGEAGVRAVQRHLDRLGIKAVVTESETIPFSYDVRYEVEGNPLVSIVIPNKDESLVLERCLLSILEKSTYENYEIIIVENNSSEKETFELYEKMTSMDSRIHIIEWKDAFNFSGIVNQGIKGSNGEFIILLNNDTEVITPDWIELMLGYCQRDDVGAVGARLWYPDDVLQHGGVALILGGATHLNVGFPQGNNGYFGIIDKTQNLSAVTAACMMTSKATYEEVGGFDEEYSVAFNDVDYCLKIIEAGKLVVYLPLVNLYHYESLSRGFESNSAKKIRFVKETSRLRSNWAKYYVDGDPFYNKNLATISGLYWLDLDTHKDEHLSRGKPPAR